MSQVTIDSFDATATLTHREVTSYEYGDDGIRVSAPHEIDTAANVVKNPVFELKNWADIGDKRF